MMYIRILAVFLFKPQWVNFIFIYVGQLLLLQWKEKWEGRSRGKHRGSGRGCSISTANPLEMLEFLFLFFFFPFFISFVKIIRKRLVKDKKDDNNAIGNNCTVNRYYSVFCHAVLYVFLYSFILVLNK